MGRGRRGAIGEGEMGVIDWMRKDLRCTSAVKNGCRAHFRVRRLSRIRFK
jgi:hypothetical protein